MSISSTIAAYDSYAQVYDQEVAGFWDNFPSEFIDPYLVLFITDAFWEKEYVEA